VIRNGRAELNDFMAVVLNPFAWQQFAHTILGAFCVAGFFVLGISAWHLARKSHEEFFNASLRIGAGVALVASILVAVQGHFHGNEVARIQPVKLAAMESHWETRANAPMYLLQIPGENGNVLEALPVPSLLSILAYNDPDAVVKGLNDVPAADRPPVVITFWAFRAMVGIGTIMPLIALFAWTKRRDIAKHPWFLKLLPWAIPLPYLGLQAGWVVAEVGRQPWIVHGLMRTSDAVSPIAGGQVGFSLAAIIVLYTLLGAAGFFLAGRAVKQGPDAAH